jgi:hypothetical protein
MPFVFASQRVKLSITDEAAARTRRIWWTFGLNILSGCKEEAGFSSSSPEIMS